MIPELEKAVIHVWFLRLDSPPPAGVDPAFGPAWLDAEEFARMERLAQPGARQAFIQTRLMLRGLLGAYLGMPPGTVRLIANAHGKPRLAGSKDACGLVFNVSHSGDRVLLAFAWNTPLGVDVEQPRPRRDLERLASFCLSVRELERWRRLPAERKLADFTRSWTAKESFVKATGRGIALGMRNLALAEDGAGFAAVPASCEPAKSWVLRRWRSDEYRYALVHGQPERPILLFPSDPESPIEPD